LEETGWSEFVRFQKIGFAILEEFEKFDKVKVFTIPSMEKPACGAESLILLSLYS
jgi:hypothetical protein